MSAPACSALLGSFPMFQIQSALALRSDAASGKLALVFELMEQNLYELIQGRAAGLGEEHLKRLMFQLLQACPRPCHG